LPHTEFQPEPFVGASLGRLTTALPDGECFYGPSAVSLEALLLGLQFRDWLTDSERSVLQQFTPRSGHIILFAGEQILNPHNADELPENIPSAATGPHSDAIFTHRCRMSRGEITRAVVHTARIGTIRERDLTLAICEPERDLDGARRIEASDSLLSRFRTAFRRAAETAAVLQSHLPTDTPYLAVNRASGRVLTASDDLIQLLGRDRKAILDVEYSSVSERLRRLMATRGLHMDNFSSGEMHLAVISVLPERRKKKTALDDPILSEFFIHAAHNRLAAITAASSHLANLYDGGGPADGNELTMVLASEAVELGVLIDGLDLLHGNGQPCRSLAVIDEITRAAQLTGERLERTVEIRTPLNPIDATLTAPDSALRVLTASALRSHDGKPGDATTTVTFTPEGRNLTVTLTTRAADGRRSIRARQSWLDCTARLAEVLGVACTHHRDDDTCFETTLKIPLEEISPCPMP